MSAQSVRVSAPPVRVGRCFRTGPDGAIPLQPNWAALLGAVRGLGPLVLQTRHAGARLIGQAAFDAPWSHAGAGVYRDAGDQLDLRTALWGRADAYLRVCGCCGSPGRIEVHGHSGADFLQLCATERSDLHRWSELIEAFCTGGRATDSDETTGRTSLRYVGGSPRLPFAAEALLALMERLRTYQTPVRVALCSEEASHSEDITPHRIEIDGAILSVSEPGRCAQVALPLVRHSVIDRVAGSSALHLLGSDDWLLLSFAPVDHGHAHAQWEEALNDLWPGR